jgi:heme/copper-type cytochrome/quinol oxidase subunit 3
MPERRFTSMHGVLTIVLVAAAAFTASFTKMANEVEVNIQPNLAQPIQVLGAEAPLQKTVLLIINSGDQTLLNSAVEVQENDTVLSVITRAAAAAKLNLETQKFEFGTIINSIGGVTGGTDGKYWLYSVNGQDGTVGVDQYTLQGSEIVSFRFATS